MLSALKALLLGLLGPLTFAKSYLENLDADKEGWDDNTAAAVGRLLEALQVVISFISEDVVSGQARGLVAITAVVSRTNARLDEIIATGGPYEQYRAEAQGLVNDLKNPAKVYQAERGEDARVLREGQEAAAAKLATIFAS